MVLSAVPRPGVSVSPGNFLEMEILCPGIRNLGWEVAPNLFFDKLSQWFCYITVVVESKEPWRLLAQGDRAEVVCPDASSRGAVLSMSWEDWRPKKGKKSRKGGWERRGGSLAWGPCAWMQLTGGTCWGEGWLSSVRGAVCGQRADSTYWHERWPLRPTCLG